MTRFLFWNLHRADAATEPIRAAAICTAITRLVRDRNLDFIIFAENELTDEDVQTALDAAGNGTFHRPPARSGRVAIWTRWQPGTVIDRYNGQAAIRLTIRQLLPFGGKPAWLVAAHLWDRTTLTTEAGRALATTEISTAIRRVEARNKSSRTILVGDLNLNPFEAGSVAPKCLHAMMTAELARKVRRLAAHADYPTFYNPMWGLFGDRTDGPPGTYYWENAKEETNHFWQMYDQVLVRPDLIDSLGKVEILAGDGTDWFVAESGRPRVCHWK